MAQLQSMQINVQGAAEKSNPLPYLVDIPTTNGYFTVISTYNCQIILYCHTIWL